MTMGDVLGAVRRRISFTDQFTPEQDKLTQLAPAPVTVAVDADVDPLDLSEGVLVLAEARGVVQNPVTTDAEYRLLLDVWQRVKHHQRHIDAWWKPFCDAAYAAWKAMTGRRSAQGEPYALVHDELKALGEQYLDARAASTPNLAPPAVPGVTIRKKPGWELVDVAQVNREYLMLDTKKIDAAVKALGPVAEAQVGGIKVVQQHALAGSAKEV